jgi:SAM-dependent methyltransferase
VTTADAPSAVDQAADPGVVWGLIHGLGLYWALVAALRLGIFEHMAPDRVSALDDLAGASGVVPSRLEVVLDALGAARLVTREGAGWRSSLEAELFLSARSPRSMADLVTMAPGFPENWPRLDATLRGERPPRPIEDDAVGFYRSLVRATFATQYAAARALAARLTPPNPAPSLLDLGAGAAPWAIALLEAWPAATADVNDLPGVLDLAETTAAEHGVSSRCRFIAGDYLTVPLPSGTADVVVLGHVCRAEAPARAIALVDRAASAVGPNGVLLLADYIVDDGRRGPVNALLLGLTMTANTVDGRTYERGQLKAWLASAGLADVTSERPLAHTEVLVARRSHPSTAAGPPAREEPTP